MAKGVACEDALMLLCPAMYEAHLRQLGCRRGRLCTPSITDPVGGGRSDLTARRGSLMISARCTYDLGEVYL